MSWYSKSEHFYMSDNVFDMFSEGTSQSTEGGEEISTDVTEGNIFFFFFFFLSFSKSNRVTLEW